MTLIMLYICARVA